MWRVVSAARAAPISNYPSHCRSAIEAPGPAFRLERWNPTWQFLFSPHYLF